MLENCQKIFEQNVQELLVHRISLFIFCEYSLESILKIYKKLLIINYIFINFE